MSTKISKEFLKLVIRNVSTRTKKELGTNLRKQLGKEYYGFEREIMLKTWKEVQQKTRNRMGRTEEEIALLKTELTFGKKLYFL